jgi:hypothetical protein
MGRVSSFESPGRQVSQGQNISDMSALSPGTERMELS